MSGWIPQSGKPSPVLRSQGSVGSERASERKYEYGFTVRAAFMLSQIPIIPSGWNQHGLVWCEYGRRSLALMGLIRPLFGCLRGSFRARGVHHSSPALPPLRSLERVLSAFSLHFLLFTILLGQCTAASYLPLRTIMFVRTCCRSSYLH